MGAWGPGPFENDTSMDWVLELRKSEDPGYPLGVLRKLDGVGRLPPERRRRDRRRRGGRREPRQRIVSLPLRPAKVRYRTGDVAQLLTSTGKVAYIQLAGRTSARVRPDTGHAGPVQPAALRGQPGRPGRRGDGVLVSNIPFPESLLRRIECGWRPWMGTDDDWMYPAETRQPPQAPLRPDPYLHRAAGKVPHL
jgi:hypothetical protein